MTAEETEDLTGWHREAEPVQRYCAAEAATQVDEFQYSVVTAHRVPLQFK